MTFQPDDVDQRHLDAIADAEQVAYWLDGAHVPDTNSTLVRNESCDLCVVGGGYTGLWTAIIAKERDPSRDVVLIEAHAIGNAASGRNGGFMDASLTHGISNGLRHFPDDIEILEELGMKNLDEIEAALRRIDEGSYGYCVETDEPINLRRLEARPIASLSLHAQEQHERMERIHRDD